MSSPDWVAAEWLVELLDNDVALTAAAPGGVFLHPAPAGTAYPFVSYSHAPDDDTRVTDRIRVMASGQWRVAVWHDEQSAPVDVAAAVSRLDELLERADGDRDGTTITVERLRSFNQQAPADGDQFHATGGWFRYVAH